MATMEKPKVKKKKTKQNTISDSINDTILPDLQFPSTSGQTIISHDCFVSAEFQSLSLEKRPTDKLSVQDEPNQVLSPQNLESNVNEITELPANITANEEDAANTSQVNLVNTSDVRVGSPYPWTQNIDEPSAPSVSLDITKISQEASKNPYEPLIQYPNLDSMRKHENELDPSIYQTKVKTNSRYDIVRLTPFTSFQMKELYCCHEIEMVKQFELEFLTNTTKDNFELDPLYILLKQYALARNKVKMNLINLENTAKEIKHGESCIWKFQNKDINYVGVCADKKTVKGSESIVYAEVQNQVLNTVCTAANKMYDIACFTLTTNKINAEVSKMKIEQITREILSYSSFAGVDTNTLVKLNKTVDHETLHSMSHLRRVISIFFSFIRMPCTDKVFMNDIKTWLTNLIALYLRVATNQDHWFLLFHILRCPSGVASWATNFLQIPNPILLNSQDILQSPEISHCISILYILLLPIKNRNEFLSAFAKSHKDISNSNEEDIWILVDSDGEEGNTSNGECIGLKENDFIMLLNQIPIEMIFRCAINAEKQGNDYNIQNDGISENQLIKLIAFSTSLVKLFGEGLLTYNTERYKQFAKILGRLIRHTIHYITDINEMFIRNNLSKDPYLCERISVELNAFVIKSCRYIYKTPNLGTWQYFLLLPFELLDSNTLWQLFYYLNVGFPDDYCIPCEDYKKYVNSESFWDRFKLNATDLADEDLYYLIQTFFEMANERDVARDSEFIKTVCLHIYTIGFVNESTREVCYKTCRDMLTSLTLSHPELTVVLLKKLSAQFNQTENAIYLFKSLPLENWKTDIESFEILSTWLLNYNYEHSENVLARVIISHLNWGFDENNRLFLPHNIHVRMACLICEALNKHNPEVIGVSGVSESVRQVSHLIDTQTTKEHFSAWCWNMVSLLRLHLMDQNWEATRKALQNPSEHLCFIPELENFSIIYEGVSENRPLAMFISILVSLWGHSIPLICQKGISQMRSLITDHRHASVIRCIQLITPLFLDCPNTLSECESFQGVIKLILNSDRTYLKMVKDLVLSDSTGPVYELFSNMIQCQIISYLDYGLLTPTPFIKLWLKVLTSIPNWHITNLILIDNVIKIAYQFPDSWSSCKNVFHEIFANCSKWKVIERSSALKLFLGSGGANRNFPTLSSACGWFSLLLLETEHELQEMKTQIWPTFTYALFQNSEQTNFDSILKKACASVGCQQFSASSLVLYKYANLIANMDICHPLFPIFNQKFFILYFVRIGFEEETLRFQHTYGISDKFYEQDITLMKKLKNNLKQAEEFYSKRCLECAENTAMVHFYRQCSKMMKTYLMWLEETNINKISRDQNIDLPPQYNPVKLKDILNGNEQHWTEFLYLPDVRKEQKQSANKWMRACFRYHTIKQRSTEVFNSKQRTKPIERIKKHLSSYNKPLDPPALVKHPLILKPIQFQNINNQTLKDLRKQLQIIQDKTESFNLLKKELSSLNGRYKDLMPTLYENVVVKHETKKLFCSSLFAKECTGPACITIKILQPKKIEKVQLNIDSIHIREQEIIKNNKEQSVYNLVLSIQNLEHIVRTLVMCHIELRDKKLNSKAVSDVAIQFFYDILNMMNNNIQTSPPCYEICQSTVQELGVFIQTNQDTQGMKILELSLKRPELLKLLSDLFMPSRTEAEHFLNMYKFIIDSYMKRCDTKVLFVLMSKFDLPNWLQGTHPKLSEINRLLKMVLTGLENWNQPKTTILQDLFRRHLVHIFNHEFPEHFGEVLKIVLNAVSEQKIVASILLDLLNSLMLPCGCEMLDLESSNVKISMEICKFATQQNLFNFKSVTDTITLFAQHFQNERLQHGLHGLYPKHKNYAFALAIWFSCLSHVAVVTAIYTYPGLLADQLCDWVFTPILNMYSPWIVVYKEQDIQQSTANWIRQFITNGKVLYPWSELHVISAKILIESFINSLMYILDSLPVSGIILNHIFDWYHYHFATSDVGHHIRSPIHTGLIKLPWHRFSPQPNHIESFYKLLHEFLPECHSFLGYIFLNIEWSKWMRDEFQNWTSAIQNHIIALLQTVFIEISFEPHLHDNPKTSDVLNVAFDFPWHLVSYQGIESIFNWLIISVDPIIVLQIPSESNAVDKAISKLLQITCGMFPGKTLNNPASQITAKQILYIRSIVRNLRSCSVKHQKLLATQDGAQSYRDAIVELLNLIEKIVEQNQNCNKETYAQNMVTEIIGSIQSQNEFTSNLFIDAIKYWQADCNIGSPVLFSTLNVLGLCKKFNLNMYSLIELTIYNYFRFEDKSNPSTWKSVLERLGNCFLNTDLMIYLQGSYLLSLHAYILYKLQYISNLDEKITFLQDLSELLQSVKTNQITESRIVINWGAIIACGCEILLETEKAKKPLLTLARHLQEISKQSEGWGETILGAIGFKSTTAHNKRKIFIKCLACLIFSVFPDTSSTTPKLSQEQILSLDDLKNECNNKSNSDLKQLTTRALQIIDENYFPQVKDVPGKILNIIQLFYDDHFIKSVVKVWHI